MKLEEMADVLDGLALTLERHLGKTADCSLFGRGTTHGNGSRVKWTSEGGAQ